MDPTTEYRLAPGIVARSAGAALVLLAVIVVVVTIVSAAAGWSLWVVGLVAAAGVALLLVAVWWAVRRAYVVRLDQLGYQVRLVRGAGAMRARWADVADASTADVRGVSCVVLSLRDGRTTTIPVGVLAADRDEFVRSVGGTAARLIRRSSAGPCSLSDASGRRRLVRSMAPAC